MRRQAAIWAVRPFTRPTRESVDYLAEDWDNLLILDACRYDTQRGDGPWTNRFAESTRTRVTLASSSRRTSVMGRTRTSST
ncbi:hypothetical protein [Haladaptatus sp. GCM10025893]|uniref:hypothetical protein n=1 Tax=Haladaptatus sp. GCM10025893 TaxID=3252659 RepID=UPI00360F2063